MRIFKTFLLSFLIVLAIGVYLLKTDSKVLNKQVRNLKNRIETIQSKSDVLRVEIAHLERPDRLLRLSRKYLNLQPYDGSHFLDDKSLRVLLDHKRRQEQES